MPELPEVETMRRGVASIAGRIIASARRTPCRLRPITIEPRIDRLDRAVRGRRIVAVDRLGKRVLLRLDTGDSLVLEPRMTGLVLLADPPNQEHLRFRLELAPVDPGGGDPPLSLWYWDRRGLGSVRLLSESQLLQLGRERLGPDALDITADQLRERLHRSRRPIKPALLDQRAVAGVGNLYASELLHRAGVSPLTPCCDLSRPRWRRIHQAMLEVLHAAIEHEGSTLSDGTYRNALNQDGSYQNQHQVYDREGLLCPRCGRSKVVRIVQAQRATFYCGRCQRR